MLVLLHVYGPGWRGLGPIGDDEEKWGGFVGSLWVIRFALVTLMQDPAAGTPSSARSGEGVCVM